MIIIHLPKQKTDGVITPTAGLQLTTIFFSVKTAVHLTFAGVLSANA